MSGDLTRLRHFDRVNLGLNVEDMGSPINVLDKYYLAITLLVTVGYQLTGFAIAWTLQFDKITDFTGGVHCFMAS